MEKKSSPKKMEEEFQKKSEEELEVSMEKLFESFPKLLIEQIEFLIEKLSKYYPSNFQTMNFDFSQDARTKLELKTDSFTLAVKEYQEFKISSIFKDDAILNCLKLIPLFTKLFEMISNVCEVLTKNIYDNFKAVLKGIYSFNIFEICKSYLEMDEFFVRIKLEKYNLIVDIMNHEIPESERSFVKLNILLNNMVLIFHSLSSLNAVNDTESGKILEYTKYSDSLREEFNNKEKLRIENNRHKFGSIIDKIILNLLEDKIESIDLTRVIPSTVKSKEKTPNYVYLSENESDYIVFRMKNNWGELFSNFEGKTLHHDVHVSNMPEEQKHLNEEGLFYLNTKGVTFFDNIEITDLLREEIKAINNYLTQKDSFHIVFENKKNTKEVFYNYLMVVGYKHLTPKISIISDDNMQITMIDI